MVVNVTNRTKYRPSYNSFISCVSRFPRSLDERFSACGQINSWQFYFLFFNHNHKSSSSSESLMSIFSLRWLLEWLSWLFVIVFSFILLCFQCPSCCSLLLLFPSFFSTTGTFCSFSETLIVITSQVITTGSLLKLQPLHSMLHSSIVLSIRLW